MSAELRVLPAGDRALLLEPGDPSALAAFVDALHPPLPDGVEDVLPAARTVLVTVVPGADLTVVASGVRRVVADRRAGLGEGSPATVGAAMPTVEIPVRYDGEDLDDVAGLLGVDVDALVAAHTGTLWRCAFIGFAPGFGYLEPVGPWTQSLAVPRRPQSRTAVPAGAVALADGYSAVYPRRTPGGWQLIGTSDAPMWDLARTPPNLVGPGTLVRFVDRGRE